MTDKNYIISLLNRNYIVNQKINFIDEKLIEYNSKMIKAPPKANETSRTKNKINAIENSMMNILDYKKEKQKLLKELDNLVIENHKIISCVCDDELELILIKKYLSNESYEQISIDLCYSVSTVKRKHKEAIEKILNNINGKGEPNEK